MMVTLEVGANLRYVLLVGAAVAALVYLITHWWMVSAVKGRR